MNNSTNFEGLRERVNNLTTAMIKPDMKPFFKDITGEGGVTIRDYALKVELVNGKKGVNEITLKDPALIEGVRRFQEADAMGRLVSYGKAYALYSMKRALPTLNSMGYKTVGDFAYAVFGLKRETVNKQIRAAEYWINPDLTLREFPENTALSTMMEALPYVMDNNGKFIEGRIATLYAEGTLVDGMSQNKLDAALKAKYKPQLSEGEAKSTKAKAEAKSAEAKAEAKSSEAEAKPTEGAVYDNVAEMSEAQAAHAIMVSLDSIETIIKAKVEDKKVIDAAFELTEALRNLARALATEGENK